MTDAEALRECIIGEGACYALAPNNAWICTRPATHDGEHIACQSNGPTPNEVVSRWPNEAATLEWKRDLGDGWFLYQNGIEATVDQATTGGWRFTVEHEPRDDRYTLTGYRPTEAEAKAAAEAAIAALSAIAIP